MSIHESRIGEGRGSRDGERKEFKSSSAKSLPKTFSWMTMRIYYTTIINRIKYFIMVKLGAVWRYYIITRGRMYPRHEPYSSGQLGTQIGQIETKSVILSSWFWLEILILFYIMTFLSFQDICLCCMTSSKRTTTCWFPIIELIPGLSTGNIRIGSDELSFNVNTAMINQLFKLLWYIQQ